MMSPPQQQQQYSMSPGYQGDPRMQVWGWGFWGWGFGFDGGLEFRVWGLGCSVRVLGVGGWD